MKNFILISSWITGRMHIKIKGKKICQQKLWRERNTGRTFFDRCEPAISSKDVAQLRRTSCYENSRYIDE